jgi:hypothetical protein
MNRQKRKTNITIAALKVFLGAALLMLVMSAPAYADTIVVTGVLNLTNCGSLSGSCPTATYTFTIGTQHATLDIMVTGGVVPGVIGPPASGNSTFQGVDLGFTPSSNITLLSGTTNATGSWTFQEGSLNNSNCGSNNGAFLCSFYATAPLVGFAYTVGTTYSWTWNYNAISPSVVASVGDVHIGANYGPAKGTIVSATGATSPIPEPSSLALFGTGLVTVAGFVRRRTRRNA